MKNTGRSKAYDKISPTARLTAWWRAQSGIPYALEIARAINAEETAKKLLGSENTPEMAMLSVPAIEARYGSVNYALKESGLDRVLEIACGLSPRGLEMASNKGLYVGTDLQQISAITFPVLRRIAKREGISEENLQFQAVNALDKEQLGKAVDIFKGQPLAICNEGLLMYLDNAEKTTVAQNIKDLLRSSGGVWITTDIAYHEIMFNAIKAIAPGSAIIKNAETRLKGVSQVTGRDFRDNYFSDEAEAVQFYKNIGFTIREFPMYNGDYRLSSLSAVPVVLQAFIIEILSFAKVWMLTPDTPSLNKNDQP
jgi:hypothetical protein